MKRLLVLNIFIFSFISFAVAAEPDTTSARIYFPLQGYKLTQNAKIILNDVLPDDSSITLTGITIYGTSLAVEKHEKLALKRAQQIKKYLVHLGIKSSIIHVQTMIDTSNQLSTNHEIMVPIKIDYDAALIEKTIIIRPPAKQTEEF
jgi:hypothetical protein